MGYRFLFTCGGTAGHINPALGVAGRIRELMPDAEFLFVGAEGHMEAELVPLEGYELRTLRVSGLRRGHSVKALMEDARVVREAAAAVSEAKKIIRDFKPDAAVGTGGYVCFPVLQAAHALGVPTALHESNAVPGLTTKLLAGRVSTMMVGFEDSREFYRRRENIVVTGTPVRTGFRGLDRASARARLGIPGDKPLVVSVWGSLGAGHMNDIMVGVIDRVSKRPSFRLIHAAGKRYYKSVMDALRAQDEENCLENGMDVREYIYDMPAVMAAADLILCRAGASTLAELMYLGKPAILVPSPNVTNAHQEKNARVLESAGGAKVLLEGQFTADSLLGTVSELLADRDTLKKMGEAMRALSVPEATDRIAEEVLSLVE